MRKAVSCLVVLVLLAAAPSARAAQSVAAVLESNAVSCLYMLMNTYHRQLVTCQMPLNQERQAGPRCESRDSKQPDPAPLVGCRRAAAAAGKDVDLDKWTAPDQWRPVGAEQENDPSHQGSRDSHRHADRPPPRPRPTPR